MKNEIKPWKNLKGKLMIDVTKLLDRKYSQGVTVTNCVLHMGDDITKRPDDCKLCLSDLRNHMNRCIAVNAWLNTWKDDATEILGRIVPV